MRQLRFCAALPLRNDLNATILACPVLLSRRTSLSRRHRAQSPLTGQGGGSAKQADKERENEMTEELQYSLIVGQAAQDQGRIWSSDAQLLREFGTQYADNADHAGDLVLLAPCGRAMERFDIWTRQWRGEG